MRIAILSCNSNLFSCQRLRDAAKERGHNVDIIDPLFCYMKVNSVASSIYYRGEQLRYYDAVIPRISPLITFHGIAVLRQLEMLGSFPLNESRAITQARNKLHSLQLLALHGIDLPVTGFVDYSDDTSDLINMVGGAPLIVKLLEGTQGIGVVLAETRQVAESVIDAFRSLKAKFLVQEFIAEAGGVDIRCLALGNEVVASIQRQAKTGDFRSNLHRGGTARQIDISTAERAIAIRATSTLGLNVAGVDIIRADRGPLVIEVNASPGLQGIETISGLDIAAMMIQFIETRIAQASIH